MPPPLFFMQSVGKSYAEIIAQEWEVEKRLSQPECTYTTGKSICLYCYFCKSLTVPCLVSHSLPSRDKLQTTIEQEEQNLATSRKILSNYEILGPEFEELVKEYTQLQAIIENRRWAVTEFNKD